MNREIHTPQSPKHQEQPNHETQTPKNPKKPITLIPLIFLIYFEVSGGPYGEEPTVAAAGPLLAIIGFFVFPFIWSIPEALVTAELSTAYPNTNAGYVIWAASAFGPFWGSLMGSWKYLSGVINNAAYPVLCADYLKRVLPHAFADGYRRDLAITGSTILLSFFNYTGLTVVGYAAVALGVVSLMPFLIMLGFAVPKVRPKRWVSMGEKGVKKDWRLYFNTLFWNLNYWDNASTLAGEVERPQKTVPKALLLAGLLTCLGYLLPLFAATGALEVPQEDWYDGFLADAAGMIAGNWLKIWVEVGAVLSGIGLYEAQLSSCAYQMIGMAELGLVPKWFASRSKWFGTSWLAILLSTAITLAVSFMSFENIIASANFLYSLGMLLEFSSFIRIRYKYPTMKRPYRVPMRIPGLIIMCLVPTGFLIFVMVIGSWVVYAISAGLTALGVAMYFAMGYCRSRGLLKFIKEELVVKEVGTETEEA
ncbi:putative polyamine transporter [Acorus calamus]|uniref:Polyamine transporter PUT1 n=1 Tax=Acorus calamus TaxID=4465 RepID=A0AAV9C0F3_ACOCL|nr:putative polyamine transporter [Acorus calamus]